VAAIAPSRQSAGQAPRWVAANLARLVGTWVVVGAVFAAAIMIVEGDDGFIAPASFEDALSVPFTIIVFVFMAVLTAAVGLMLFTPLVAPGLAVYLLAVWWGGRAVPERWRRVVALALSPVIPALVLVGADWVDLELSMLAGSAIYGALLRLP
jgi:hypothetical protein